MSFIDDSIKRLREEEKERRKREQAAQLIRGPQSSSNSNSTNSSTSSQNSSQTSQGGSQSPSAVDKLFHSTARKYTNATANDNVTKNNRNVRSAYTNSSAREKANSKKSENEPSRVSDIGKWLGNEFMAGIASGNEAVGKSIIGNAENINKTTKVPFLDRLAGNLLPNGSWNVMKLAGELGSSKLAHDVDDYFSKENEKRQQNVAELRGDSGLREKVGNLTQVMSEQLPMLAYSLLSGGSGGAASGVSAYGKQVATSLVNPASLSTYGNYITRAVAQAGQNMSENPYFWDTFLKTFGPAYYKEKDEGANDAQALVSAATNSFAQSAIEIGGGFETAELKEGFLNKLKEVIKSSGEEGSEEIWQDIVDNLTHKALGSNKSYDEYNNLVTTPWFSTVRGKDAVINPANMIEQGAYGAVAGGLMTGTSFAGRETMNAIANSNYRNANPDIEQRANELIQRASLQEREGEMATRAQNLAEEVSDQMARGKAPTAYQMRELERAVATDEYYNDKAYQESSQARYDQAVNEGRANTVESTGTADEYYGFQRGLTETEQRNYDKAKAVMGEDASERSVVAVGRFMTGSENNSDIDTILLDPKAKSAVEELTDVTLPINNTKARAELENLALAHNIANNDRILEEAHNEIRTNMSRRGGEFFDQNYDEAVATIDEPNAANIYENFFSRFYTAGTVEGADFEKTYNRIISPLVEDFGEELGTKISQVFNHDFAQKVFAEGQIAMNSVRAKAQGKRLSVKASENPAGFTYEAEARKHISDKEAELFTKLAERAKVHIRLVNSIAGGKANGSYDPETGVILIAADSDNKFITVFKHELTHHLKNTSPEMYQKLEDFVFKRWYDGDPEKMEERVQEYQRRYGMKPDEAREEIIADASEAFFTDQGAINDAVTFNEKMARAIHDGIKSLLDTFLDLVDTDRRADKGYGDFLEDLDILRDAEKMWLEALNESVGKQKGSVGNKADLDAFLKENGLRELPQTKKMSLKATEDSEGKRLTEGQKRFFKNSRATDEDGKLAVVYHTTESGGFTVFDPKYSDDKRSLFFASNFDISQTYGRGANRPINPDMPEFTSWDDFENYAAENFRGWDNTKLLSDNLGAVVYPNEQAPYGTDEIPFEKWIRRKSKHTQYDAYISIPLPNGNYYHLRNDSPSGLLKDINDVLKRSNGKGYYTCYLNLKNPLVVNGRGDSWHDIRYSDSAQIENMTAYKFNELYVMFGDYNNEGVPTRLYFQIEGERKNGENYEPYEVLKQFNLPTNLTKEDLRFNDERGVLIDQLYDYWENEMGFQESSLKELSEEEADFDGELRIKKDKPIRLDSKGDRVYETEESYSTRDLAEMAEKSGYDGVIIRDIRDVGGRSRLRSGASPYSDIYIAFNSNQVKLTSNEDPTEDDDIRYSLKESDQAYMDAVNRGDMETAQRMVDEEAKRNGYNIKVFHGTPNETISASRGRIRGDDYKKLATDYADKLFPYVVFRNNGRLTGIYTSTDRGIADAFSYSFSRQGTVYDLYARADKPFTFDAEGNGWNNIPINAVEDLGISKAGRITLEDVSRSAKEQGYDAVVVNNVRETGSGDNESPLTTDVIVFSSTQLKSADPVTYDNKGNVIPLSERFNENNEDIRYSLAEDSDGNKLSEGQREYFGNSKIVDSKGNLKVMYHGSPNDFDTFDIKRAKAGLYGRGFYFTEDKSRASQYGKTYGVYLDIETPLQTGSHDITRAQLKNFIKVLAEDEDYGIENYGYGATVDSVLKSVWGKDDFAMLQDLNASAVGDFAEAVKLFNKVNGTSYDGIIAPTETIVFYPEQIKEIENKNPTKNPNIHFSMKESVEETKDLLAVHNLKAEDLRGALDLGGFPMPSIAIIKAAAGHDMYGDFSAIFDKKSIDPKASSKNVIYGGDAWTPTFPHMQFKPNDKVAKRISEFYYENARRLGYDVMRPLQNLANEPEDALNREGGEAALIEGYKNNPQMMRMFLRVNDNDVETVVKRTETTLSDGEISLRNHFINAFGEDGINEFAHKDAARFERLNLKKDWVKEHKDEISEVYSAWLKENGFTEGQIKTVLDNMKLMDYMTLIQQTQNYIEGGATTVKEETDIEATNKAVEEKAKEQGYDKWVDDLFKGIEEKKGIRNNTEFFTRSGNRRSWEVLHDEPTLVNIVNVMAAQDNGETIFGSSLKAVGQKRYKNISEVRADKGRLKTISEEEYKELMDSFAERENEIITRIDEASPTYEDNPFIRHDEIRSTIVDNVRKGMSKAAFLNDLKKWASTKGATAKDVDDIFDLVRDVANIPTGYFEAKPKRPVTFEEVKALLAPSDAPNDLISRLQDEGVNVVQYEAGNSEDRIAKLNQAAEKTGTKFSLKSNGESRSYQSTITKLENQVKDLKSEFKRTNLKTADQKQVRIQAGKLITRHGSNMQAQKSLIDTFNEIFRLYKEKGTDAFDEVYEIAKNEAVNIVNNISVVHNEGEETYKAIKDYLRNTPITISEDMKRNITDFNDFRKRYFGKLKITNGNTTNIDTVYMELMELFPEQFTEDYVNPADQLYHMADVLDNYAPYYETLDGASEEMQDYVVDIASDIMETAYGLQTKKTFADKKYEEKVRAVEKARQKALESRDVALDRQKKRYEKKLNDLKQHNKDVREGRRERKEESELRSKLLKVARRLDKMKTTKENRTLIHNLIGDMDLVAKSMTGKTLNDLNDLRNWYDEQKEADPFFYDSNVEAKLKRLTKKQIANMDINDVRDLNEVLRAIETSIRTADKFLKSYYNKSVKKAGLEVIEDVNNSKGVKDNPLGTVDRFFINGTLSPERQIHRITGYNDNDPLYVATKELSKGQRDMLFYQMNSWNMFKKFMKDKQFINSLNGKKAREIGLSAISKGKETTIKVTPDVAISLYLSSMNDDNMRHMGVGGVEIPDIKAYKNGELKKAYRNSTRVTFSKEQLAAIEGSLTKQEKAFADTAHEYYNSVAPKAINEVSEILKGYSLAQVENYFPIQVNKNFLDRDFESLKFDGTIEGMGSLKERVKASNPIVINGIVDTITRSINENSMYVGLAIPVRNYSKLLGVKNITYTESDRGGKTETKVEYNGSVNESISKKWGDQAMKYIEKFMTDLQTSRGSDDDWEAVLNKWRSNYAGAVLTLNASVAIKQAASYPTAMAVLGAKPLARAMADVGKVDLDLIEKYTPLQWYRSQGYSTKELGDIRAGRKGSAVDKLTSVPILNWIQAMDVLTTRKLWKASEYYVRQNNRSLKQGSDEYYKAVADIYNRVIEETQPNYTVMQRPGLLRSDKSMVQMLNMFKTQPYQNFNILYDSIGNYKAKAKVYKKDKSSKAQADVKKAYKDMQNAVLSQVLQLAVFAAMTSLWALFRGKDDKWRDEDGKLSIESYMKQLGKDMLSGSAAMIPLGADLYNAISSAITGDYYYGFSSVTDSSISDLFNSLNQTMTLIPSVAEYAKERRPGEPIPDDLKKSSKKLLENTSRFSGIPYSNLRNLWDGVYRWVAIAGHGEYVGEYLSQKATFAKTSVMMDNLYKAYRNDKAQYDELRQMMIDDGIKESSIDYGMKDRMKKNKTEAEQKEYDDSIGTLEKSALWRDADAEDKEDYEKILEKIAVGIEDGDTESYAKLASSGVSEEQAILYKLALKKVDKPNKNGNLGTYTNDEKEAALRLLMKDFNLTAKQKEALKG